MFTINSGKLDREGFSRTSRFDMDTQMSVGRYD